MTALSLTGLRASTPLGALAAFGLLRVCSQLPLPQPVRLSWRLTVDWSAELWFARPVTANTLTDALAAHMATRADAPVLTWRADIKAPPAEFAAFARQAQREAQPEQRETADFIAAFGSELITAVSKPEVKPTALHMTAGQQKFLQMARSLAQALAPKPGTRRPPQAAFQEALFGPWQYQDSYHAMGWDPATERLHALRAQSPSKDKPRSVAAAVWLAFEALPLVPAAATGQRLVTGGFDSNNRCFSWPVWEMPLDLATVRSLLGLAELTWEQPPKQELRARGICHVYRARRAPLGEKGYAIFRTADLVV